MTATLTPVSKQPLFGGRKRSTVLPSEPVVGDTLVAVGIDGKAVLGVGRDDLRTRWRARLRADLTPAYWWSRELLVMRGDDRIAMWSTSSQDIAWSAKSKLIGGESWDGWIVGWKSLNDVELHDPVTGQVQRAIKVGGPGRVCSGLLISRSAKLGDPVCAMRPDGQIAWKCDLVAQIRSESSEPGPNAYLSVQPSTVSGQFTAGYGESCAACSLEHGKILWRQRLSIPSQAVSEHGLICVLNWKRFVVIDEAMGTLQVDRTYPELQPVYHVKRGSILGDLVVFVSESGHVVAFNLTSGDLVFLEEHQRVAFWGSAVADGRLLVSGSDGNLWVYERLG